MAICGLQRWNDDISCRLNKLLEFDEMALRRPNLVGLFAQFERWRLENVTVENGDTIYSKRWQAYSLGPRKQSLSMWCFLVTEAALFYGRCVTSICIMARNFLRKSKMFCGPLGKSIRFGCSQDLLSPMVHPIKMEMLILVKVKMVLETKMKEITKWLTGSSASFFSDSVDISSTSRHGVSNSHE